MTQEFENMLYLFGCGALGKEPDVKHCVNIKKIREQAINQNVWPIVYSAIRNHIVNKTILIPEEIYVSLEKIFVANIAKEIQRTKFSEKIIKDLEKNGIKCCTLKGYSLASLYKEPETRISGDTDILVREEDEQKTVEFLNANGYKTGVRLENEHHVEAEHPIGGVLEVHIRTMQKDIEETLFGKVFTYSEEYIRAENGLNVLGINDGLYNVVTHFIKHFLRSGAGVRHMMDMLLYMKKYEKDIDWAKFNLKIKQLGYDMLIDTVKTIGEKYWGLKFDKNNKCDEQIINQLLTDIEMGGIFGNEEMFKSYATVEERRNKNFQNKRKNKYVVAFRKVFPSIEYMKKFYKESYEKHGIIIAYLKRIVKIAECVIKKERLFDEMINERKAAKKSEIAQERISLMENLGIIEKE